MSWKLSPLAIILILLIGCDSSSLESKVFEKKISIGDVEYEIHVFGYDSTETTGYFHYERIEIKSGSDADPIQVLNEVNHTVLDGQGDLIGFVDDYNFDGLDDFRLKSEESYFNFEPYAMWLYDEKSGKHEYHNFLESAAAFDLDKENMQIVISHGRGDDMTTFTYKYQDGQYVSVKEVVEIYNYENDTRTVTINELIDGKLQQTDVRKFHVSEDGEVEIKKSGQVKGQQALANFLWMIDGRKGHFRTMKIVDGEHLRWHDSCVNPGQIC
ncbi:MAG: hypothetical protein GY816_18355 [Cytophagales bacterium]|nr:hypothetical protein [Cytophagales bacterium]